MKTYRIERGPVSPPASLYGQREPLATGATLRSAENSWIRKCLADGRMSEVAASAPAKSKRREGKGNA